MKYMLLIQASALDTDGAPAGCTPADWMEFDRQAREAGIVVSGESMADFETFTTVRVGADGHRTVTDGPFVETRELLGGFYVIDVPDLDSALDWAARCPGSRGGGAITIRPVAEFAAP